MKINMNGVEASKVPFPLPPRREGYTCKISDYKVSQTKAGDWGLSLKLVDIESGAGYTFFKCWLMHKTPKAQEIGIDKIAQLVEATGIDLGAENQFDTEIHLDLMKGKLIDVFLKWDTPFKDADGNEVQLSVATGVQHPTRQPDQSGGQSSQQVNQTNQNANVNNTSVPVEGVGNQQNGQQGQVVNNDDLANDGNQNVDVPQSNGVDEEYNDEIPF